MHAPANRPTLGFILLAGCLTAFGAVSIDFYLPALPAIAADYDASTAAAQLTMSAFLAGMAIGQLGFGPLSDRVGRRPPLLAGIVAYTLVSLALAFAPSIAALALGRFAQGLAACSGVVIARAIIRDRFDTTESARLFSLTFLVLAIAPMLAPTVGAWLMALFGWHSIFLVLALFGLLVGLAVFFRLPESRTQATAAQAALESPMGSYRAALANRRVLGFVGAGALNGASLFTYVAGSPALFISHFGQPPSAFGWIFALNALGLIITSQLNRHLLTRLPPDRIARAGALFAMGFSALLLGLAAAGLAGLWVTMALLFLGLGSYGFVSSNSSALALGAMPQRAGAISALIGSGSFAFGAAASALTAPFAADGPLAIATGMAVGFAGSAWCLHRVVRW
jgi:DHA1 family bicyclomycin/chloramphenicol resistance-like MFS transporter